MITQYYSYSLSSYIGPSVTRSLITQLFFLFPLFSSLFWHHPFHFRSLFLLRTCTPNDVLPPPTSGGPSLSLLLFFPDEKSEVSSIFPHKKCLCSFSSLSRRALPPAANSLLLLLPAEKEEEEEEVEQFAPKEEEEEEEESRPHSSPLS